LEGVASVPQICVVDEQSVFRIGLCALIESNIPRVELKQASSLVEVTPAERKNCPFDLVLLDPGSSGFYSINAVRKACDAIPASRYAIVSASDSRRNILLSLGAGFHGFVSKHLRDDDIVRAINDILAGRIYVPPAIAESTNEAAGGVARPAPMPKINHPKLTQRQREVLLLLVRGMSNKEIARQLGIAESTTRIHTTALIHALGVRNRTEAAFSTAKLIDLFMQQSTLSPTLSPGATDQDK
jgi:DNA-binding NarL/FixJ family response regulator